MRLAHIIQSLIKTSSLSLLFFLSFFPLSLSYLLSLGLPFLFSLRYRVIPIFGILSRSHFTLTTTDGSLKLRNAKSLHHLLLKFGCRYAILSTLISINFVIMIDKTFSLVHVKHASCLSQIKSHRSFSDS